MANRRQLSGRFRAIVGGAMSNALYDPTPFMEGSGAGGAGGAGGVGGGGASGAGGPPYVVSTASDKTDTPKDKDDAYARSENLQVSRTDMNLLIMNYLVTEGFKDAALMFQQEAGLSEPALSGSLDQRILIREAVQNGRIQEATALVNALHPELLDNDRYLYFHLQQLQLIELVKAGHIEAALGWARAALAEAAAARPAALPELERSLALLAFPDPNNSPFADLLQPQYSQSIASELNAAILRMENQEFTSPKLSSLLRLILWAQAELDKKNIKYPKMTDLAAATIEQSK